ncbi:hypothetical protein V5P93_003841 [Actinokineospora auranticolor]|uniref:Uncharacterized protein n=1 Tax=Actinokineospora auranticolor TaxID=155976 RepID=A0A2S6GLL9_9PSEU|nr:hypothetical protein [Actinokineospora auranticolor]PPK66128.1 hypothetical protein CLV40_11192 [Actinokineospora auranticolor]
MTAIRALLVISGLATLGWGVTLFADWALPLSWTSVSAVLWLIACPLVHDALIAPAIGLTARALDFLPAPVALPAKRGLAATAVLAVIAFPLVWRPFAAPAPPGAHDEPLAGLLVSTAVVWIAVAWRARTGHSNVPEQNTDPGTAGG